MPLKHLVFIAAGLLAALPASAGQSIAPKRYMLTQVDSVPASEAARAALEAINDVIQDLGPQPTAFWVGRTRSQNTVMQEEAQQKLRELAVRFCNEHPDDPLRWVGVEQMLLMPPKFITGFKPGFDTAERLDAALLIVDEAAKAAWKTELARYDAALEAAADVPWEIHERRAGLLVARVTGEAMMAGPAAIGAAEKQIDTLAAQYPDGRMALALYSRLLGPKMAAGGEAAEEIWGRLSASPNRVVVERAKAELRMLESARIPMDIAFTAVDGRAVDLKDLRGKVVLVDFWATWCGPCVAELPNVRKVYAAYHDKGFEVVGIALENPGYTKKDTPEQHATKLAAARKVLTDFTAKNEMPWPQYFDGEWWKTAIAAQHAVNAIPAMFLLGPDGRMVSSTARGEKLEAEVKRLLKL